MLVVNQLNMRKILLPSYKSTFYESMNTCTHKADSNINKD